MLRKIGILLVLIGLLLIAYSVNLGISIFNDEKNASFVNNEVIKELHTIIDEKTPDFSDKDDLPSIEIDGNRYLGIIEVPSVQMSLPVYKDWDYDKLKIGPCLYTGSFYNNDMIIMSHNYSNQFDLLKKTNLEDIIYFISADKVIYTYKIEYVETLEPTQVEYLETKTDWDLTLFTCNFQGITRHVIRCSRVS